MFRPLLQAWLQNAAKANVREAVMQAAQGQVPPAAEEPATEAPQPCHLGLVFALPIESGCFEDLLQGMVTIRGKGFVVREGGLAGRRVAMTLCGPGQRNAARATEVLIDGHRPQCVISAGFAGGLCPGLKRNDIFVADRLVQPQGGELAIEASSGLAQTALESSVHRGCLLTVERVVRLPDDKRALSERYGAQAVDMETFAVGEVCRRREVAFSSIRVINDSADEALPSDVEHLLAQKPGAAQWGAALGTVWRRPASIKDLYMLRENALVASGRLAQFLAGACAGVVRAGDPPA